MSKPSFGLLQVLVLVSGLWIVAASALAKGETSELEKLAAMPQAVSNNAVALVPNESGFHLYSALGLTSGKTWQDTSSAAYQFDSQTGRWSNAGELPGPGGRLAASAVVVNGHVYVFGGYTVAEDGSEQSTPGVYRLEPASGQWRRFSDMPVPVEDSVVLVHQDRYIYLVSGWHDLGNVNLVQVLDTHDGAWRQATPWPGDPVFGHAGALSGGRMLICDGVKIEYSADDAPRKFLPSSECWLGVISPDNFRRIDWRTLGPHPGPARYRMAAGADDSGRIFFAGGSVNPYNFDGVGYDGKPSEPEAGLFSYNLKAGAWECHGDLAVATMDHRGMPWNKGWFYLPGGMRKGQKVSSEVLRFRPAQARTCRAAPQQVSERSPE